MTHLDCLSLPLIDKKQTHTSIALVHNICAWAKELGLECATSEIVHSIYLVTIQSDQLLRVIHNLETLETARHDRQAQVSLLSQNIQIISTLEKYILLTAF